MGRVLFGVNCLGFRVFFFGFRLSFLGLGDHILDCESIFGVLGLGRGFDLLTFTLILGLRTLLDGLITLGHLSPLVLVTSLASPF